MLLSGEQIRERGLISDAAEVHYRASSYDLSVGEVVPSLPDDRTEGADTFTIIRDREYVLPPQGMVRVVSRETVRLPEDVSGYALVKNALCSVGVLAINIGIIDPGYEGPISSALLNFGKAPFLLTPGMAFMRLSFHECAKSSMPVQAQRWTTRSDYVRHCSHQVLTHCATKFLNLQETAEAAGEKAFGEYKQWLGLRVGVIGAFAALAGILLTILVPLGASYVDRYVVSRDRWQGEAVQSINARLAAQNADSVKRLEEEIKSMRAEVERLKAETRPARPRR